MLKIFTLTYNELIKQFKGKGTKVLLALLLIISVILPIALNLLPSTFISSGALQNQEFYISQAKENMDAYENDKSDDGKINLALTRGEYEYNLILKEGKVNIHEDYGYNDWRQAVAQEYRYRCIEIEAIKLIMAGMSSDILLPKLYNVDPAVMDKAYDSTKVEQQKLLDELVKEKDELRNIIVKEDYLGYLEKDIANKTETITNKKKELAKAKEQLKKDSKNEDLIAIVEGLEIQITRDEELQELDKYRYNNKIDYKESNWKNKSLLTIEELIIEKHYKMKDEDQYKREASMEGITLTYEQYKEQYQNKQVEFENTINKNWHSVKNNLPQLEYTKDARTTVNMLSEIYIIAASIVIIILGGGIIANEFSTGTIRLLMIRPVSRIKILVSKLLSLLVFGYVIIISTTLLSMVTSGFIYGFNTLNIPILEVVSGTIVEQNFILFLISNMVVSSLSFVFIASLVFALSTLTKNTAVAVAVSIVLYLGASTVTQLLAAKIPALGSTFVPFINQSMFNLNTDSLQMMLEQSGFTLNAGVGLTQLMALSVVLVGISFYVFSKKDIQN